MSKKGVDIRTINFNNVDDLRILLLFSDKTVTSLAKEYVIRKYLKRIKRMEFSNLSLLLFDLDLEIMEVCSDSIKSIFDDLSILDVETLAYGNKKFTRVSELVINLLKYDWFAKNPKYLMIKEAYELEQLRDNPVSNARIVRSGNKIIGELAIEHDLELMSNIFKNYLYIVEKNNLGFVQVFREKGYKYLDNCIKKNKDFTKSMMMFDAYMLKFQDALKYQIDFEFYENMEDPKYARHVGKTIKVNLAMLLKINHIDADRKFAIEYWLFVISHEFMMAYFQFYLTPHQNKNSNLLEELKMHNIGISEIVKKHAKRGDHKDHYIHEYCANIEALKEVYIRYGYLKSFNDADKKKFNCYISKFLIKAYKSLEKKNEYMSSPVEYTFTKFQEIKSTKDLQNSLVDKRLTLPTSLKLVEKSLSEFEKLELGYANIYVQRLVAISNGEYQVINIFEE